MTRQNANAPTAAPREIALPEIEIVSDEARGTTEMVSESASSASAVAPRGALSSLSKGVDVYSYLTPGRPAGRHFGSTFTQPINAGTRTENHWLNDTGVMQRGNLQISTADLKWNEKTGRFSWTVYQGEYSVGHRYAEINPVTGELGATDLGYLLGQRSELFDDGALSFGFYDSGPGIGGLTNQDQSYVYVTAPRATWMADLVRDMGPALSSKPFGVFALPGAHDAGMFDPTCLDEMVTNAGFLSALAGALAMPTLLAALLARRAAINMAFTQKDTVSGMLNLGVRYFDFRPGHNLAGPDHRIYHQHNFIPGCLYSAFLEELLRWLVAHPGEIVVVSANFQGFASPGMQPSVDVLNGMVAAAQANTGTAARIVPGDKSDLARSYDDLLRAGKRLIFLNQIGAPNDACKYDSYSDAYQTTSVRVILDALAGMNRGCQECSDYTVLQLQGTATGTLGGKLSQVLTFSNASSPLMSTKAAFDHHTYPWVLENVPRNLLPDQLVVLLNDFADNALTSHAMEITRARARQLAGRA